jgi:hypothetical protein
VLRELAEERAAALLRISRTLEALINQLHVIAGRIAIGDSQPVDIVAYRDLREQALLYRWYLEVQRESLGMRQHHMLDELYRIPGPLTE